ncbi:hypothetical protein DEAC_c21260 [Desulfosporosinus acididurans]|uniref:Uncharacterized protein n=1 Tax=Desulfosporosinus acididurans TaxID=476652 RepID=A0A0J1FS30_9FIRM|nr:hypothetical protein [Desulfosporosinus acididurans]KLU66087.1 hypothetical protein DEAC_c21260 [Desulfosporosinus acididurans]
MSLDIIVPFNKTINTVQSKRLDGIYSFYIIVLLTRGNEFCCSERVFSG